MIFAGVLRHVCYKQAAKEEYVLVYRCLCKCARWRSSHTPKSRSLLQLFVSPHDFEACSRLPVSLPLNPSSSSTPLLLHFMHFCFPSSLFLPDSSSFLSQLSLLSNVSSCHWTKWNVAFPSSCCTLFPSLLLHHRGEFYLLSPACNLTETPNPPLFFPFFIFSLLFSAFLSWLDTCGDWTVYLLWYPRSLWSLLLLSSAFDSAAPWNRKLECIMMGCHLRGPCGLF